MNESEKNIETCLPESILAEVSALPTDPQFVSLVNESLDPLKQQAFQQAGSDAYNEVVASHQPYTFTSLVRQMKSNLILLLRRLWRFPFGSGTLRSLSDMWAHYITRLQGSETYGIPSRLDQLTDLPSAPLLVADRKIGGVPEAEDGISLVQLMLCSTTNAEITELQDDTQWNGMRNYDPFAIFPNLTKLQVNCETISFRWLENKTSLQELSMPYLKRTTYYGGPFYNCFTATTELNFQSLERVDFGSNYTPWLRLGKMRTFTAENMRIILSNGTNSPMFGECPNLEEIDFPRLAYVNHYGITTKNGGVAYDCPKLWKVRLGGLNDATGYGYGTENAIGFPDCPNLVHLEIGCDEPVAKNVDARWYDPTNALDATGTDLVEDPTAHPIWNNLQQFLQNFRSFIVLRLANRKSTTALTLTLSANVYNAVTGANSGWASQHTLADLGITDSDLTDLETELGITSATIYATWLDTYTGANGIHWDINKAN